MIVDCTQAGSEQLPEAVEPAVAAVREGRVVVVPTDTVYGVGADAFDQVAVAMVLAAKHRGRDMPPPVLVANPRTVDGLAADVPMYARILMRRFWPGPLTLVLRSQPSLAWDLGETNGTVALRMPQDEVALALLAITGPMAITSANVTGQPPASTVQEAQAQLGGAVSVYLDGGERTGGVPSTIVDCTGDEAVVLRQGAIPVEELRQVLGSTVLHDSPEARDAARTPQPDPSADPADPAEGDLPVADDDFAEEEVWAESDRGIHGSGVAMPDRARRAVPPAPPVDGPATSLQ